MARKDALTGTKIQTGNNVSKSNRKTKRIFAPNLQPVSLKSDLLNETFHIKITTRTLRTITKYGSLDEYLLHTNAQNLTEFGAKLKSKLKKIPEVMEKLKQEAEEKKAKRVIKVPARILKKRGTQVA
jgi:large subunit ribosomal protein L28